MIKKVMKQYIPQLVALRGLATILVMFYHYDHQ